MDQSHYWMPPLSWLATRLAEQSAEIQLHTFLQAIGHEGNLLYEGFQFTEEEDKKVLATVLQKFADFSLGTQTKISLRADFYRRVQRENEGTGEFISDLFRLSENCKFTDRDSMVRDKIALGTRDEHLRERIFHLHDLDLKKVMSMCRADETAKAQTKALKVPVSYVAITDTPDKETVNQIKKQSVCF